ncbi:MAG: sulfurtransferase [Galactobacter sp.]
MSAAPLIDADELDQALRGPKPPKLLDVRWRLTPGPEDPERPVGYDDYLISHLPHAVFVDLATELAATPSPELGRHPLPTPQAFAHAVARWGVAQGQELVFYDDQGGMSAARGWWLARHAGLPARVLSGGLAAWVRHGGATSAGAETPPSGTDTSGTENPARPGWGHLPVLSADGAAALAETGILLDARAGERYRGETEPIDPRAGHIPGALSAPTAANLGDDGSFRDAPALAARFADLGATPGSDVGVYCGSGVTASHQVLALAVAGIEAALYPGSWSQYSSDPARPVAVGDQAVGDQSARD